ncbi:EpsG family protein [Apilactobacillus timberlakei]|uniref:EpsG family protein n=1 Tax=Apilactobacillus timberlakei TaxID=2008380 RepID=UPI00112622B2|nr:EpsG family protein [Apilactobacillus timberlakei]TPR20945.1 EpsG family protein [Apilactobacillus timberlakei]TPR23596.1 EpsG family protein [Apilactobacillus timberlakei]
MIIYYIIFTISLLLLLFRNTFFYTNRFIRISLISLIYSFMLVISIFRSPSVGTDYPMYYSIYLNYIADKQNDYLEKGYAFINSISQENNNFILISFFLCVISFIGFYFLNRTLNINSFTFTFLYVSTFLFFYMFNIIRQFYALSILLIGISIYLKLYNNHRILKYIFFVLIIFLAKLFHNSSLFCLIFLMFPIIKFKSKYILYLLVVTSFFYFTGLLDGFMNYLTSFSPEYILKYSNADLTMAYATGFKAIIKFVPVIIQFLCLYSVYNKSRNIQSHKLNFILSGELFYLLLYSGSNNILFARLQFYLCIFPVLFSCICFDGFCYKNANYSFCTIYFKRFLIIFWTLYFVYRIVGNSAGVVPYSFI